MKTALAARTNLVLEPHGAGPRWETCPLCGAASAVEVATHLAREEEGVGAPTFAMIKAMHAGWLEEDGACAECWGFYRNLVRVLNASGAFDPRFRTNGRSRHLNRSLTRK